MRHAFAGLLILLFTGTVLAQTTVPHTFTAGAAARASEVNANFAALATAIDNLAARVSALETPVVTAAAVAGTYKYVNLEIGVAGATGGVGGYMQVTGGRTSGTVVLNANGTATYTTNAAETIARVSAGTPASTTLTSDGGAETNAATWTVSSGDVVVTSHEGVVTNFVPASGKLLLGVARQVSSSDFYFLEVLIKQ